MNFKGGGLIPVTLHNGKLLFLLGRENKYCYKCSHKWCDWGGGTDIGENIIDTVSRESSEESIGFLGDKNEIRKKIEKNQYYIGDDKYRIYFIPVDYDPNLPIYFNQNQIILKKYLPKNILKTSKIFEKDKMEWFGINDLKKRKSQLRKHFKNTSKKIIQKKNDIIHFLKNRTKKATFKMIRSQRTKI